jgi:hypothetical protein
MVSAQASRPNSLTTAATRASISLRRSPGVAWSAKVGGRRSSAEKRTVSRTVKVPSKKSCCSQYPVRRLKSSPGRRPFKSTSPESKVLRPAKASSKVLFPPPVGPKMAVSSPARQMPLMPRRIVFLRPLTPEGEGRDGARNGLGMVYTVGLRYWLVSTHFKISGADRGKENVSTPCRSMFK